MTDTFTASPELRTIHMILEQMDIPKEVPVSHEFEGKTYPLTITRLGLNPAMALYVFRTYGLKGIQHGAPSIFFWNVIGASKIICDDYKAKMGDAIFDRIQQYKS